MLDKYHKLSQARAELALLEEQAQRLLKELLHVRAAVATQRDKVDELIRTRPTAFNLLPTEILLSIFDLDVRDYYYPERKYQLAGVCRRWKNVILDCPSLWTTIHVATSASSVMTHLERSRGALLDIVIETSLWSQSRHLALVPSLDIIEPLAHRWHSLTITDVDSDDHEAMYELTLTEFITARINPLQFPSLKYVSISFFDCSLDFLSPARAPALEHLELYTFQAEYTAFPSVTALKTLRLDCEYNPVDYPLFPHLIPTQTLTELSISGLIGAFSPQPNSIHFPSLKMLEISDLEKASQFMDAIIAPNLERFKYTYSGSDDPPSIVLGGLRSKFTSVRHLSLCHILNRDIPELLHADAIVLCEVFPGVRHVEFETNQFRHFFDPTLDNARTRCPIDLWTELESLTICGVQPSWLEPYQFSAWLVDRKALGLRQLHVKLVCFSAYVSPGQNADFNFLRLYEVLKENCTLELDNFPLTLTEMRLYMPVDSRLRVVSTPFPLAGLYSPYMCLVFAGANNRTYG